MRAENSHFDDEFSDLHVELGDFVVCSECAKHDKGKRSVFWFESSSDYKVVQRMKLVERVVAIPGKKRESLRFHGFMCLLMVRSAKFRKLLKTEPYFMPYFDDVEPNETLDGLIESTILINTEAKNLTTYLKHFPDWTIAAMAEIRRVFLEREKYAPDYLMMCFQFSELKTDDEIDALVKEFFPNYVGAKAKDRRGKLKKKIETLIYDAI